jgi:hypothetical protein
MDSEWLSNIDDISKLIQEDDNEYKRLNPPDFTTHFNYVQFLSELSKNIKLESTREITKPINKVRLLKLTIQNLEYEKYAISKEPEYAKVCISWIPVKSYYLIFNMMLLLKYLTSGEEKSLDNAHGYLLNDFTSCLSNGELVFSEKKFNQVLSCKNAHDWKSTVLSNNLRVNYDVDTIHLQLIKILGRYKEDEYKRRNNIPNIKKKYDKNKIMEFRQKNSISLFEFFYWYRIKANYRDLDFLDQQVEDEKFAKYFMNYYTFTMNMHKALAELVNNLSVIRFNQTIL